MERCIFKGRVWKFGDNINTDIIAPAKYLHLSIDEIKKHIMEPIDPHFYQKIKPGDIIVAGRNFGCGSSREQAPAALKAAGISIILAISFARIFFRNSISIGLPVLPCKDIFNFCVTGDFLKVDLKNCRIHNLYRDASLRVKPLPQFILDILNAGGIIELIKRERKS